MGSYIVSRPYSTTLCINTEKLDADIDKFDSKQFPNRLSVLI